MKKYFYIIIAILILTIIWTNNQKKDEIFTPEKFFKDSYKKQKDIGDLEYSEHLDTLKNVYSNYYFNVSFDAPDDWNIDNGVNDHTIFRTFQKDSAITFMINVIESKIDNIKNLNIWEIRQNNGAIKEDSLFISIIKSQSKSDVMNYNVKKSTLKNNVCIKRNFETLIQDLDFEYVGTNIMYQTIIENKTYTFGLSLPKMFYDLKPEYYENIFRNIYFLNNKDKTSKIINSMK